jgi:hypothetical protein
VVVKAHKSVQAVLQHARGAGCCVCPADGQRISGDSKGGYMRAAMSCDTGATVW